MKTLQTLKNRLLKFKPTSLKKNLKQEGIKAKRTITNSFSNDDDTFMFI